MNFGSAGISYNDGGTQKIRFPYRDTNEQTSNAEFDSADDPGAFTQNANVSDNDTFTTVFVLAVEGTNEHLLYSERISQDLFHDENDGTDTELLDAVTINAISSNVYTRECSTVLAYLYDDAGTVKYNELVLIEAPARAYHHYQRNTG